MQPQSTKRRSCRSQIDSPALALWAEQLPTKMRSHRSEKTALKSLHRIREEGPNREPPLTKLTEHVHAEVGSLFPIAPFNAEMFALSFFFSDKNQNSSSALKGAIWSNDPEDPFVTKCSVNFVRQCSLLERVRGSLEQAP